jgi:hypothetical protein
MNIINVHSVENFLLIKTFQIELENSSLICERQRALYMRALASSVSVVSEVRERVRDFKITFALYVKKIFISGVC